MMHGHEKSDPAIVAGKPTNEAERTAAELVEPRAGTKGNAGQQSTRQTQCWARVSHALDRIRQSNPAFPSHTRGGSRMRESRTYGSVRGARGNLRSYREDGGVYSAGWWSGCVAVQRARTADHWQPCYWCPVADFISDGVP